MEETRTTLDDAAADEATEIFLGYLLRTGVLLAAAIVLVGGCFYVWHHRLDIPDYHVFHAQPPALRSVGGILKSVWSLHTSTTIIQLGMLVLLATPVLRVIVSVYIFLRQRDWIYVLVTLIVLGLLGYGILKG